MLQGFLISRHKFSREHKGRIRFNGHLISLILLALLLIIASCAKPYNPFIIERSAIRKQVSTIAVFPMRIPYSGERFKAVAKRFEGLIAAKLKEGGFNVVGSEITRKIIEPKEAEGGGMYDPATGEYKKKKALKIIEEAFNYVTTHHNADAIILLSAIVVRAEWYANTARWHGVEEPTSGEEGFLAEWRMQNIRGDIAALSLQVTLTNKTDRPLYKNFGGIQLRAWVKPSRIIVKVPENQILANPDNFSRAVDIALAPLVIESSPQAAGPSKPR